MNDEIHPHNRPARSLRLIFSYKGSEVHLVSMKSIEMLSPPSDPIHALEGQRGFWYELRDTENRTLYRRVIQNPIKYFIEVRSDNPKKPLMWEKVDQPEGDFILVVPDFPLATTIKLFSSPLEHEAAFKPASELVNFNLRQHSEDKTGE